MPFCSRRTWKTPSGFTTWPTPRCYDDGVVLPRFRSHTHTGKTTGVYHDNHPDTAPDAGLRVPLLTRHHPGCCPTFIPAFTDIGFHLGVDQLQVEPLLCHFQARLRPVEVELA